MGDYNNAFEYMPRPDIKRSDSMITYTKDAVLRYRAESIDAILHDSEILVKMIRHHQTHQVPRLEVLEEYYLANNPMIMLGKRRQEKGKSDHRIRHSFASIISDFLNSYVLSNPVKIADANQDADQQSEFLDCVNEFNKLNDIDSHNIEIGKDQNNFGRAYELLQRTADDEDKVYRLDPREVFMIYDTTVRARVIGACRYFAINQYDDSARQFQVELYTPTHIWRYKPSDILTQQSLTLDEEQSEEHAFHGVPIVEYRSDRFRMSVYERQLSQIDAYDAAQSDTANYMTDFNDALLVIEGRIKDEGFDGEGNEVDMLQKMKDANVLLLIPEDQPDGRAGTLKASYLTKSYDVAGVEAYKTRLKEDIFNFSATPNLSDDSFSGTQSGEALKYKMFGLQQKRSDKEKFLAKGFRVRYALLENLKREVREYTGDHVDLDFSFTPNLPKSELEEMATYISAGGQLSQETMLGLLSFVDDVSTEKERIEQERMTPTVDLFADDWGLSDEQSDTSTAASD